MAKETRPNVIEVVDGRLHVDVALANTPRKSASGRNMVYFTTEGLQPVNGGFKVGINLIRRD